MMVDAGIRRIIDEAALRRTAEIYALGADRRDADLWRSVLAPDCVMSGPGFHLKNREECLGAIGKLNDMFRQTQHRIFNQTAEIEGDSATGETYCSAEHVMKESGDVWCWAIRYQDRWRREADNWLFTQRELVVDWMEMRPLHKMGESA